MCILKSWRAPMPKCHDTQREEIARGGVRCPVPRSAWHRDHRFRPAGEKGRAKPAPPASAGLAALRLGRQHDRDDLRIDAFAALDRSEEHTSELQSLMRISYAVFCLKKKIR